MKLEQAYAQALFDEVHKKKHESADTILKHLKGVLLRKGHQELLPRIAKALGAIEAKEVRKNSVKIAIAKGNGEVPKEFVSVFEKEGVPEYEPCQDENLVGGFVAKGKGFRVDGSYKTALLSLYQSLKS
jgi:F0F1-type ATP synthase delta subunit